MERSLEVARKTRCAFVFNVAQERSLSRNRKSRACARNRGLIFFSHSKKWQFATRWHRIEGRERLRRVFMRFSTERVLPKNASMLGRNCRESSTPKNAGSYVAARDRVWLPGRSAYSYLFQANGHARSSAPSWRGFTVCLTAIVASLQGVAYFRYEAAGRAPGPASTGHDRLAVVSLGAGFGRISRLIAWLPNFSN